MARVVQRYQEHRRRTATQTRLARESGRGVQQWKKASSSALGLRRTSSQRWPPWPPGEGVAVARPMNDQSYRRWLLAPRPADPHCQAEGPRARRFEITRRQLAVIDRRLFEVLCRQGLWQQDVGFGFNYERDPNRAFVLINPGRSRLTARQILDRLLGRG